MKERRNRVSLSISGEAEYKVVGEHGPPVSVIVKEISKNGLRFVTSDALPPNVHLQLSIKITSFSEPIYAEGKVIWQRQLSSRFLQDTCIRFVHISNENSNRLIQYIYEFASSTTVNREYVRCSLMTNVKMRLDDEPDKEEDCLSADICVKGMKLFADRMLDVGKKLTVSFALPNEETSTMELKAKVAWRKELQKNKILGLEFIDLDQTGHQRIIQYVENKLLKNESEN